LWSLVVGVGHICTAVGNDTPAPGDRLNFAKSGPDAVAFGVGHQLPASRPRIDGADWFAVAVGVCNNPDAIPSVRGIDGASWNNKWGDFIPDAFQVRKAALEAQWFVNKTSHIFANDPLRP
jgi:hypothetical protein